MMNIKNWIVCFFVVFCPCSVYADIYFPDTTPITKTENTYDENKARGKEIYSVSVVPNQMYYAFATPGDITIINCPYKIIDKIAGAQDVIRFENDKGGSYLTIKPNSNCPVGFSTTLQIITKNDFRAVLKVVIVNKKQANRVIKLLDGRRDTGIYDKSRFQKLQIDYKSELTNREKALSFLFFKESKKYIINSEIRIKTSSLTLSNLTVCGNTYFYNLVFEGDDDISLDIDDVFLYISNYSNFILSEQKKPTVSLSPSKILLYKDSATGAQLATIAFELASSDLQPTFYSDLHIAKKLIFNNKINLNLLDIEHSDLFNMQVD